MGLGAPVHARAVVILERGSRAAGSALLEPHGQLVGGTGQQEGGVKREDTAGGGARCGDSRRQREQDCGSRPKATAGWLEYAVSTEEVGRRGVTGGSIARVRLIAC